MRRNILFAAILAMISAISANAQIRGLRQVELKDWQFSKDGISWEDVTIPHSYNAEDGHSKAYYRGDATYKTEFRVNDAKADHFLVFEGAAQKAIVKVNGVQVADHRGGYTAFPVNITEAIKKGINEVEVICDNRRDLDIIPVESDFNKNGGLHNPVFLVQMEKAYFSPESYGLYRLRVEAPEVAPNKVATVVKTKVMNTSNRGITVNVRTQLIEADGSLGYQADRKVDIKAFSEYDYRHEFVVSGLHLWNGVKDPYLYTVRVELFEGKRMLDIAETKVGYRYYHMDPENGFYLNGKPYPLRGVAMHQDMDGKATALTHDDYRRDYRMIKELGANFLRLAHYPHNDFSYQQADSLGIIVQTEIPWVNVCGVNARQAYFNNIHDQMEEMINNLFNHPSICFWGMWNELDSWGNNDSLQGGFDADAVVYQTGKLYEFAKSLDPWRYVGVSDDSAVKRPGYTDLKVDYLSENRYNGWYYDADNLDAFSKDMEEIHKKMGVTNVSEYGAGINPFSHVWDPARVKKDDACHFEEFGNMFHESYWRQILKMPWLNFTSAWVLFDFPVSGRQEGYMDSDNGETFKENPARKHMNDKGLVTRDRQTKKDVFYFYKSLWNKSETTVYFTSRRLKYYPAGEDLHLKVYSNAKTLTLYQNGRQVERMKGSGESTRVIWQFAPLRLKTDQDTFIVVADDGTTDEITLSRLR